ncbi:MAG: hydrogenase maturation protease [Acidobacteria bacterium]|nr:hydrogenase maturation protease [Acidobacteriota bacterium]
MSVGVFGIGNVLMGDDAIGPAVVGWIASNFDVHEDVVLEDLGTPGLELPTHLAGHDQVVFIDAVAGDAAPGTVVRFEREAIVQYAPGIRLTPHDPALKETLLMLELTENAPREVYLIGIVPCCTTMGSGLSDEMRATIPAAGRAVLAELERLGVPATPRSDASDPVYWWDVQSPDVGE